MPTATVISPPTTAASKMATPSGKVQCQPKNWNGVDVVFWVMKISNKIRIRNPAIRDDHSAPARVNPMAGSLGAAPGLGTAADLAGGWPGEAGLGLLIGSSLSDPAQNETTQRNRPDWFQRRTDSDVTVGGMRMPSRTHRATVQAAVLLTAIGVLAACSSSDPLGAEVGSPKSIVVGSGDFPESHIIAEIYAQALQANGFEVGRRMGIGSRETYIPALKDHSIDLVPEYIGNLLLYFEPESPATVLDAVELELDRKLPGDLAILTPSPAADTDTVTVTDGTANSWKLKTIADLAAHSSDVRFGAPSAFASRPAGLPGLRQKYGLDIRPGSFVAINDGGGAVTVRALVEGRVNAANVFTTSPAIPQNHLVVLEDPEHNFIAGNIVPLVNSQKKSDRLKQVLDAVSAKLTTTGVAGLNAAVSGNAGIDPDQAARNWLRDNGFNHPVGQ